MQEAKPKKKRMSYNEQREWDSIDGKIAAAEKRLEEIAGEMAETGSDFMKANELLEEEASLNEQLEELIERWSYLAELAEG